MKYLITTVGLILCIACYSKKPEHTSKEGKPLPAFNILLPDATTQLNTNSIAPGNPIIIFIFGPHCPYSKAQMKDMLENEQKLKDIRIIAITPYPFKQMKEFYETFHLENHPNFTIGTDSTNSFGNYIMASAVPYIAVYNKDKKLVNAYVGTTGINIIKKAAYN